MSYPAGRVAVVIKYHHHYPEQSTAGLVQRHNLKNVESFILRVDIPYPGGTVAVVISHIVELSSSIHPQTMDLKHNHQENVEWLV